MKVIPSLIFVLTVGCALLRASHNGDEWPLRDQETIQKTMALAGDPMRVLVDNVEGYVHVTGTSGSQVRVTAHKSIHAESDRDLAEARREVELEFAETPGSVSIEYDAPWRCRGEQGGCHGEVRRFYRVKYDIDVEVPRGAHIVVSTINDGDVRVDKTTGRFEVKDINGGISMVDVGGSGEVDTINGPVSVRFARNPAAPCRFKTLNGQVDVYFQPALAADLLFKTFNGEIFTDFDVTARSVPSAHAERRAGKFVYRSNGFQGARAGRGGPELSFDAFNGNIRLHQSGK